MQTALTLRRFSINSIAATFAVILAVTAGGVGGYWLKSEVTSSATKAAPVQVAAQAGNTSSAASPNLDHYLDH